MNLDVADRMVWRMAKECRNDDVLVVGVGTPVAAAAGMLARELLTPDLTELVASSVQHLTHDIARPMLEADFVASVSAGTLSHADLLDLIARGGITLQFVAPAQLDQFGRLNASEISRPDGTVMRLPGPLALPDVSCLVGRLVGYRAAHSKRFLVREVDFVTGLGSALVEARKAVESIAPDVDIDDLVARTSFPIETQGFIVEGQPPAEALELLDRVIDPHGVRGMEVPGTRAAARARLHAMST